MELYTIKMDIISYYSWPKSAASKYWDKGKNLILFDNLLTIQNIWLSSRVECDHLLYLMSYPLLPP